MILHTEPCKQTNIDDANHNNRVAEQQIKLGIHNAGSFIPCWKLMCQEWWRERMLCLPCARPVDSSPGLHHKSRAACPLKTFLGNSANLSRIICALVVVDVFNWVV